jgi:hypothetical protein
MHPFYKMRSRFFGGAAAQPPFDVTNEEQFTLLKDMVDAGNYPDVTFTSHGFIYMIELHHDYMQNMWYYTFQKIRNGEVLQEETFPLDKLIDKVREHHELLNVQVGGKRRKTQRKRTQRKRAQRKRKSSRRN